MADKLRSSGVPDVPALPEQAKSLAADGKVDPVNGLSKYRVYLFSGGADRIVARSVVEAARRFYTEVGVAEKNIALVTRPDAGHTFLTVDTGNTCEASASPFVSAGPSDARSSRKIRCLLPS
jgi:hypothetical protein